MCREARELLTAPNNVERVIARPFVGDAVAGFTRTQHRKDFPLDPPEPNILTAITGAGKRVHGVGVIVELFPKRYFAISERTQSNANHLTAVLRAMDARDADFIFANCEDFDMLFGHRNNAAGFAGALEQFDQGLAEILTKLAPGDLLILAADHGNDPTTLASSDHSREYVPLLLYGEGVEPGRNLGTRAGFADIGAIVATFLGVEWIGPGQAGMESLRVSIRAR
jgi:phosphopentomutase